MIAQARTQLAASTQATLVKGEAIDEQALAGGQQLSAARLVLAHPERCFSATALLGQRLTKRWREKEMVMPIKILARLALFAGGLSVSSAAWAVGDPPQRLGKRQAIISYAGVRALLTDDGLTCPDGQAPLSGTITGGAAPAGGSQTVTLQFNKGGIVKIVRTWSRMPGEKPSSSIEVTCQ